ncbi:MFS transporter [Dolichospermum circinale]|uniref:MFS transporter n=1 Tax=Dolichospermum circinale TaxID=109265 RepID=UPI00232B002E|nr:MFS transporter [Dolichospermum circinale]MDB9468829.1 MFS transporter [Dolichospermum circinale CS-539/09]MDB9471176.1 MFS transporter [Dolichospermum circinale CS-539]
MLRSPLYFPNFRWLWLGQTLILSAAQFWFVSLTWLVLQKTASGLAVGTVLVAAAIPRALFMLVGGAISELLAAALRYRWSTRNVVIIGGLINTFLIGIATVLLILDGFNLIVFIVIAVLFGLFEAILYPAILALLPQLVRKSQLAEANAWIQGSEQFTEVIGPAGAGFMIGAFGLTIAFAINTLIFAFGSLFIYLVRTRRRQPLATEPEKQALTGEIILGLKYAWTQPAIRISLLLLAMINFAMLGPIIIGVAALVNVKFGGNATTFGYLQSAYGMGALLGVLVASQMSAIKNPKTPLVLLCYGLGVGLIALGFVQDFWIASGIIALMGIGGGTVTVLGITWLQQNTAANMQGRIMGLTMFAAVALDPLSEGISGLLLEVSLTGLFVAAGVTMLLTAIVSSIGRTHTIKSVTTDFSFPVSEPVISVRNLNHYFGSGVLRKQVLFDINLDIQPGEIVIMTGPSGSGKTTLLTLMGGLRSAQEGSLKILGQEICGANKQQLTKLRRQIGYIFQAHNLMTFLTTQENVRMSLELHDEYLNHDINNKAIAMLESVGLGDRISYYPENLSGGQKQRVAIARALVSQPKIVLADEPTAALDKKSGRDVVELMQKLAKEQGCTILLVTHDNRILDIADRIIYMEDGQLKDVNITAKIQ